MFVHTYLWYRGLPAHVFKWGRSETSCACGPLLKKKEHTFGVLSQFEDEVFQLPSHLVHRNAVFSINQLNIRVRRRSAVSVVLTTVCWLTWMTSSPAWIFLVRSAGDWRQKPTKKLVTHAQSSNKHKHMLHISVPVQLFFALRKCQTRLTRHCCR